MDNPINALRAFFAQGSREVTLAEFTAFWRGLSEEDKTGFRGAMERWDGKTEFVPSVVMPIALPASSLAVAQA